MKNKKKTKTSDLYPSQNRLSGSALKAPGASGGSGDPGWRLYEGITLSKNPWEQDKRAQRRKKATTIVKDASERIKYISARKTSKTSTRSKK